MGFQTEFSILIFLQSAAWTVFRSTYTRLHFPFSCSPTFSFHFSLLFVLNTVLISIKFGAFPLSNTIQTIQTIQNQNNGRNHQLCRAGEHGLEEHSVGFSGSSLDHGLGSRVALGNGKGSLHRDLIHEICL